MNRLEILTDSILEKAVNGEELTPAEQGYLDGKFDGIHTWEGCNCAQEYNDGFIRGVSEAANDDI